MAVPNGFSFLRTAPRSASRRSLSRTDLTWAVSALEPLGAGSSGAAPQFGALPTPPLGNRPAYPGKVPPYVDDEPCYRQKLPDVNGPAAAKSLPTGSPAETAQVKSVRDKLRREADLSAVRRKLHPFSTAKKGARPPQEKAK